MRAQLRATYAHSQLPPVHCMSCHFNDTSATPLFHHEPCHQLRSHSSKVRSHTGTAYTAQRPQPLSIACASNSLETCNTLPSHQAVPAPSGQPFCSPSLLQAARPDSRALALPPQMCLNLNGSDCCFRPQVQLASNVYSASFGCVPFESSPCCAKVPHTSLPHK